MRKPSLPALLIILLLLTILSACKRSAPIRPTATPGTASRAAQPDTQVQLILPPTRQPGEIIPSPTADADLWKPLPTETAAAADAGINPTDSTYIVQAGDYPALIAQKLGIDANALLLANNLGPDSVIYPGDTLVIPQASNSSGPADTGAVSVAEYFKIIPDSELVYGPMSSTLNIRSFIAEKAGYLNSYTQDVDGETLDAASIVEKVSRNYSVNPRLLLALLEYRAGWLTNANPAEQTNPIGFVDTFHQGLYRQLTWSSSMLNKGFYNWRQGKRDPLTLADGTQVMPPGGLNAGTLGVMSFFASLDGLQAWQQDVGSKGLFVTYEQLFGYPFDLAYEPLVPTDISQPTLALPFQPGLDWQFTGGPHAGWDTGSAWAALDFAPPGDPIGCGSNDFWVTAVADGNILRSANGAVVEELDSDGLEQTGWTILYLHMESRDRVSAPGHILAGDKIGHAGCEGGYAVADHVHIARRYNGVWIAAADPAVPFVMDGYVSSGTDVEYDGWLKKDGKTIEAWDGINRVNIISR